MPRMYKDILIHYDLVAASQDRRRRLYCLSQSTIQMILSISETFYWPTRWTKPSISWQEFTSEEKIKIKELAAQAEWELMNPCDLCGENEIMQLITIQNTDVLNSMRRTEIVDRWDGSDVTSVHPDVPTTFYDGDGSIGRRNALCMAVKNYVSGYCYQLGMRAGIAGGLSVLEVLGGLVLMFSAATFPPLGGIGALALYHGLSTIGSVQTLLEAFNDVNALNNVVCCMFQALRGQSIDREHFEESLDTCNFEEGSHEYLIAGFVMGDLQDLGNWLLFIDLLGRAYGAAQQGLVDCPCCEAGEISIDFSDEAGWSFITYGAAGKSTLDNVVGNPAPAAKSWFGILNGYPSYYCVVKVFLPCVTKVNSVAMDYRHTNNQSGTVCSRYFRYYNSNGVEVHSSNRVDAKSLDVWHTEQCTDVVNNVAYVVLVVSRQSTGQTGSSWIDNIVVNYG